MIDFFAAVLGGHILHVFFHVKHLWVVNGGFLLSGGLVSVDLLNFHVVVFLHPAQLKSHVFQLRRQNWLHVLAYCYKQILSLDPTHVSKMVFIVHQEIRLSFTFHLLYSLDDSVVSARLSSFNFRSLCLIRFVIDLVCSSVFICRVSLSEKKESLILCMWSLWRLLTIERKGDVRQIWDWLTDW